METKSFVVVHGFQRGFDLGLEDSFRFVSGKPILKGVVGMKVVDATPETSGVAYGHVIPGRMF